MTLGGENSVNADFAEVERSHDNDAEDRDEEKHNHFADENAQQKQPVNICRTKMLDLSVAPCLNTHTHTRTRGFPTVPESPVVPIRAFLPPNRSVHMPLKSSAGIANLDTNTDSPPPCCCEMRLILPEQSKKSRLNISSSASLKAFNLLTVKAPRRIRIGLTCKVSCKNDGKALKQSRKQVLEGIVLTRVRYFERC